MAGGTNSSTAERKTPAVEVAGVTKDFLLKGERLRAVEDITFSIQAGEFLALIGPSGCGKSTLLRLVADLILPTEGYIRVLGEEPQLARRRRSIGFVFQTPVLLPWRNVRDNICLPLEVAGQFDRGGRKRADELLELVGLSQFAHASPSQLSGGMRQRASLARALILNPSVLLLDEPFGALDEITRHRMNLELLRIWQEVGISTLLVTHSIPEAVFLSHRVVVLTPRPGRISEIVEVNLPEPRDLSLLRTQEFFSLSAKVSAALYETTVEAERTSV